MAPAARSHPRTSGHPVHVRPRVPVRPARQRGGGAVGAGHARAASSSSWGRLVTPVTSSRSLSAVPAPSKCTRNPALMGRVALNSPPVRRVSSESISSTKITAGWWHRPQQTARAPSSRRPHPLGRQRGRADADEGGLCCAGNALADHRLAGPQRAFGSRPLSSCQRPSCSSLCSGRTSLAGPHVRCALDLVALLRCTRGLSGAELPATLDLLAAMHARWRAGQQGGPYEFLARCDEVAVRC
jgi:hypothetical protein